MINFDARDALIKYATSTGNQKALGALEAYALGGGAMVGEPLSAATTVGVKRLVQNPKFLSKVAQSVENAKPNFIQRALVGKVAGNVYRKNKENKLIQSLQ